MLACEATSATFKKIILRVPKRTSSKKLRDISFRLMKSKKVPNTMFVRNAGHLEIHTIDMSDTEIFLLGIKCQKYLKGDINLKLGTPYQRTQKK